MISEMMWPFESWPMGLWSFCFNECVRVRNYHLHPVRASSFFIGTTCACSRGIWYWMVASAFRNPTVENIEPNHWFVPMLSCPILYVRWHGNMVWWRSEEEKNVVIRCQDFLCFVQWYKHGVRQQCTSLQLSCWKSTCHHYLLFHSCLFCLIALGKWKSWRWKHEICVCPAFETISSHWQFVTTPGGCFGTIFFQTLRSGPREGIDRLDSRAILKLSTTKGFGNGWHIFPTYHSNVVTSSIT